jgi:hypothetical protein
VTAALQRLHEQLATRLNNNSNSNSNNLRTHKRDKSYIHEMIQLVEEALNVVAIAI